MSEFLGARISLISRSDIRYVGILHEINSDDSTVSLENVKSFGTEGRKGNPDEEVAPSDQVYEYIVFRGTDVKDLRIEEGPGAVKENKPPAVPSDPAIVNARPRQANAPAGPPPNQQGPPGGPGFGPNPYFPPPPMAGGWGRGIPGPNGFNNMGPYPPHGPPPPGAQWFPPGPGQEFPPMGPPPGPWNNNYPFPPGPGGPGGPPGPPGPPGLANQGNRQTPSNQPPASKPTPIGGSGQDKKPATPSQPSLIPSEPKSLGQPPSQSAAATGPPPPVDSKPTVEEVKATAASLAGAPKSAGQDGAKATPTGPKNARPSQILPAVPLPTALTAKAQTPQPVASKMNDNSAAALRDATQAARDAVAVAMAQLGTASAALPPPSANGNAMDNLTKKVNEMRVNATRGGASNRGGRGRGSRPGKVDVPDADFDFASSNAKFNKQEVVKEAIAGSPLTETPNGAAEEPEAQVAPASHPDSVLPAYNKATSFFDNISSEAKDRIDNHGQKPGGREWRGEEQRKNMETFGQGSVDGGFRGYRGRGRGRGGRGRGFGRGGRGGVGNGPSGGGGYRNRDTQPVSQ